ncbi:LHFPL tetraspan subfamily member 6 protein-like [Oppia nitens]|uniref:LHFPL tetraspan subfamily member 6 protein-like n=1 Tax=Oppia nitens TaxID=1686743 RepID=UPI0023DCD5AD|nr:LHFPL tetraspan subfamily member 6 protein-like [Oppia nitens]
MACKLTGAGIMWTSLSLAAAILNCAGYYVPHWIRGSYHNAIDVSFGSFRRCNYPRLTNDGRLEIVSECGRYRTFADIPSLSWQITTILMGIGVSISLLVAFTVLASCCLSDVITKRSAKTIGVIQLIAAILMVSAAVIYPYGWTSPEIRDACGGLSDVYKLGTCELSWSSYMMFIGVVMLFICFILSFKASKVKLRPYNT